MKRTINEYDFRDAFLRSDTYKTKYSYKGLSALYDYLTEYEEGTDTELELDIVAIACDFTEYEDLKELQHNYTDIETMEELEEHTTVIPIPGTDGFIIQDY